MLPPSTLRLAVGARVVTPTACLPASRADTPGWLAAGHATHGLLPGGSIEGFKGRPQLPVGLTVFSFEPRAGSAEQEGEPH